MKFKSNLIELQGWTALHNARLGLRFKLLKAIRKSLNHPSSLLELSFIIQTTYVVPTYDLVNPTVKLIQISHSNYYQTSLGLDYVWRCPKQRVMTERIQNLTS